LASVALAAVLVAGCAASEAPGDPGGAGSGGRAGSAGGGESGPGGTAGGAGTSGAAGTSGSAGTSGTAGTSGAAGTTAGHAGSTGAAGTTGAAGAAGATGGAGPTGGAGATGWAGAIGTAGRGGATGAAGGGATGSAGKGGGAGTPGTAGAAGGAGTAGAAGATACQGPAPGTHGANPLFTDAFTADPAPLAHNCAFYITCGHDQAAAGQNGFVMREWFLLRSTDMVTWTRTNPLSLGTFKWANANAWASQMVAKNGKLYWYVAIQEAATGAMAIGVAVADSPEGPFTDALGKPLVNDAFEMSNMGFGTAAQTAYTIDPTVFVDDDGQAYLHYGGFSRMVEAKLGADMISISGKMQESTPPGYFEAAYLTKRNGTYYEIYAAGVNPATIDYATSSSPMGPWTRRGRILAALPAAAGQDAPTNHAGVAQFAGQWYLVYHVSNGPNGGGTYRREVAVDKLTFNADGTIQMITPSSGLQF
jgi:hypothetical protein